MRLYPDKLVPWLRDTWPLLLRRLLQLLHFWLRCLLDIMLLLLKLLQWLLRWLLLLATAACGRLCYCFLLVLTQLLLQVLQGLQCACKRGPVTWVLCPAGLYQVPQLVWTARRPLQPLLLRHTTSHQKEKQAAGGNSTLQYDMQRAAAAVHELSLPLQVTQSVTSHSRQSTDSSCARQTGCHRV
jgi:hypothetical protein